MAFKFGDDKKRSPQREKNKQNETSVPKISINKEKDKIGQTSTEEANKQVLQQKQQAGEQTKGDKHAKKYHSILRETGGYILRIGWMMTAFGGALFASGFFYTPLGIFSLVGIISAVCGLPLVIGGGVMWIAGLISEAVHNHNISKALKQAERKSKEEDTIEWI